MEEKHHLLRYLGISKNEFKKYFYRLDEELQSRFLKDHPKYKNLLEENSKDNELSKPI